MFTQKVVARMRSAMEQSGNAWMPAVFPEANVERAIAAAPPGCRFVLDGAGAPLAAQALDGDADQPIVLVAGPEGGIEDDELEKFVAAGFVKASIGSTILRFETAGLAALAIVRGRLS
jgi:16S rRNA (uracil1498-N3)-methyltransferase